MQEVIRSQLGYSKSKVMSLLIFCLSLIKKEFSGPKSKPGDEDKSKPGDKLKPERVMEIFIGARMAYW